MVSHWHHHRGKNLGYDGDFNHYFSEMVMKGQNEGGDYFLYHEEILREVFGNSTKHKYKCLLLTYEDMRADDGKSAIPEIAKFLKLDQHLTPENVEKISQLTNFKTMKSDAIEFGMGKNFEKLRIDFEGDVDNFSGAHIRKGQVGDWVNYLSEEQVKTWEKHVESKRDECPILFERFGRDYLMGKFA